jgi:GNAT superfamily N-acetyltransferase
MMNRVAEFTSYDPAYEQETATAFLEVFTSAPYNEILSLNDCRTQINADSHRKGFDGILIRSDDQVVGFSWWFDITGYELYDRWRTRFTPKDRIPKPDGKGAFLMEFGILPTMRHHRLGKRLLEDTLAQIESNHDWIALSTHDFAHAGVALLMNNGFAELGIHGIQVPSRICLMKRIR